MATARQEIVIPIAEWEAKTVDQRSDHLRDNRLFLLRYNRIKDTKTHVVLTKYDDTVVIAPKPIDTKPVSLY